MLPSGNFHFCARAPFVSTYVAPWQQNMKDPEPHKNSGFSNATWAGAGWSKSMSMAFYASRHCARALRFVLWKLEAKHWQQIVVVQLNKTKKNLDHKIKIAALVRCWHVIGFDCCLNFILTLSVKLCRYFNDIFSSDFWDLRARSGNLSKILKSLKQG